MAYFPRLALPGVTFAQFVAFLVVNNGNSFRTGFDVVLPPFFFLFSCVVWNGPLVDHSMRW